MTLAQPYERRTVTRAEWWLAQRRNPANTLSGRFALTPVGARVYGVFVLPDSEVRNLRLYFGGQPDALEVNQGSVYPLDVAQSTAIEIDRGSEWHDGFVSLGFITDADAVRTLRADWQEWRRVQFEISAAIMGQGGCNIYIPQLPTVTGLLALRGYASNSGAGSAALTPFRVYRLPDATTALLEVQMPTATLTGNQTTAVAQGDANVATSGYRVSITGGTAGKISGGLAVAR